MSQSLRYTEPALVRLVDSFLAAEHPAGAVDHLLILADAISELAREQYASGLTVAAESTKHQAQCLVDTAQARRLAQPETNTSRERRSHGGGEMESGS